MPRGDKTGPLGEGPITGRGMGFCAGYNVPGYMNGGVNPRARGNFGFGRGMGRGNRWGFYATGQPGWARGYDRGYGPSRAVPPQMDVQSEIIILRDEAKELGRRLEEINARLKTITIEKQDNV